MAAILSLLLMQAAWADHPIVRAIDFGSVAKVHILSSELSLPICDVLAHGPISRDTFSVPGVARYLGPSLMCIKILQTQGANTWFFINKKGELSGKEPLSLRGGIVRDGLGEVIPIDRNRAAFFFRGEPAQLIYDFLGGPKALPNTIDVRGLHCYKDLVRGSCGLIINSNGLTDSAPDFH